jgi:hypothetical protein
MALKHITLCLLVTSAAVLSACNGCNNNGGNTTEPTEQQADIPDFSADSAYAYTARQCAFGPRTMNSEAHDMCASYLNEKFTQLGAKVTMQEAELQLYDGTPVKAVNIIASFDPENPCRVMICSHWDSRPWADHDPNEANHRVPIDGANDGASGVGVMLELARQIQIKAPAVGVDFVCFDAEDCGAPEWADFQGDSESTWCLGSQYWAKHTGETEYSARFAILLDMVGGKNAVFRKEGFSMNYAPVIVDKVWAAAARYGYSNFFRNEMGGYITDDHLPVNRDAGIPCIDIISGDSNTDSGFNATWHTVDDNISNIDKNALKAVGQTVLGVIYSEN